MIYAAIIVVLVGLVVITMANNSPPNINTQNKNTTFVTTTTSNDTSVDSNGESDKVSLEELAKHNSEDDCWVIYKNQVYDLTTWIDKHPGGKEAILNQCGTENFESAFKKQHGDSKASLFMQVAKLIGDVEVKGSI